MSFEIPEKPPRVRVQHPGGGVSRTRQSDSLPSDVNSVMSKYVQDTVLPATNPHYGDFTGAVDFHTAMNRVRNAEREFNMLPASVRRHCRNDPGEFLAMCSDPERLVELEELGLVPVQRPAAMSQEVTEPEEVVSQPEE